MNPTLITDLLTYALPSGFLAGAVTWLVSRRKRRNDMLADMQRSIDLLCEKRSEEHTSELQSHHDLVCRLLLEKKK